MIEFTDHPLEPQGQVLLDLNLETQLGLKTAAVYRVIRLLQSRGYLPDYGCHLAELAIEELLANAMVHGNGLDRSKSVRLTVFGDDKNWGVIIEDQGEGFSPSRIPNVHDAENLLADRGRGIHLISHTMDSLQYNRKGNRVKAVRARQTEPDPGAVRPTLPPAKGSPVPREIDLSVFEQADQREPLKPRPPVPLPDDIDIPAPTAAGKLDETSGPVQLKSQEGITIATVTADRISEDNAATFRVALEQAMQQGAPLVIDLAAVTFMSSIGIGTITATFKNAKANRIPLVLVNMSQAIRQIFKITGLLRMLPVENDLAAGIAKIRAAQ